MQTDSEHDKALNGVRGLAFLLVLLAHLSNRFGGPCQGLGKVGVWIFFVLSAFLLTRYFLRQPERPFSAMEWANYAFRRAARIVPLFWLAVLIYLPFGYVVKSPGEAASHMLFLQGNGHLWTVVVEVKFYVILPAVVASLVASRRLPAPIALSLCAVMWTVVVWLTSGFSENTHLATYLSVFLAGSIAAFFATDGPKVSRYTADLSGLAACSLIVLTIPTVWSLIAYPVNPDYFYGSHAFFGVVAAIVICASLKRDGVWSRIFSAKPLLFLGMISYSGYLIHPLILLLVSRHMAGPDALKAIVAGSFSLAAGYAIYSLIESPLAALRLPVKREVPAIS